MSKYIIHKENLNFLNIALYFNGISFLKELSIENISEIDGHEIEINISSDVPCVEPLKIKIPTLPATSDLKVSLDGLNINRQFITNLTETEKCRIKIELSEKGELITEESFVIDVHPLEHFSGFQVLPELIASYVTPNHSYVYHIKRKAIEFMEEMGHQLSFDGYQTNDPERVLQTMSAIYSAIQSEEIIYSSLPPGYEETGQRVRLLDTIRKEKFGNCIDLSLLFAACLEAVDLNPVLILVKGHIFVGCWLHDDKFSEIINDDKTAITKRISKGIREMIVVESTTVCKGSNLKFSDALNSGEAQLVEKENFIFSIDIKRARTARIRPLPFLVDSNGVQLDEEKIQEIESVLVEDKFELGTIYTDELDGNKKALTKQKLWERKLLDLSLRNNLLNLRMTRNMLQLIDIDISHLEDTLSDGKSFSILANANAEILRKYNLFTQPLHHSSDLFQMANEELKYNRLLTHYHQQDLENILNYIHKNAKQSIEENGSSTLYLAVGLLKWYDRKTPDQARFSPILLLPVELNRRSVNSKFTLKSREEETMVNITLLEFLRQEYELDLSALEQLPYDEKGVDVAKVMGILRRAVMQLKGWDVEEQLVLGNFSFSKLILWKDIVAHQDEMLESPMVKSLVEGKLLLNPSEETMNASEYEKIPSQNLILPIPTDVSQMEAVLTAQQGKSFVLHGPPGTGKSQTITNIIADALFHGKKVLFVAAKKAALDVVHKRLEQIGLDPFSLELHSNKSKKSDVLAQLEKSLQVIKLQDEGKFQLEAKRLDEAKNAISKYVEKLHEKQAAGWSLYDSITALDNYSNRNFLKSNFTANDVVKLDAELWQKWLDWLPSFESIIKIIPHPQQNPLADLELNQYSSTLQENIDYKLDTLIQLLISLSQKSKILSEKIEFDFELNEKQDWENFIKILEEFQSLPNLHLTLVEFWADNDNYLIYEEWSQYFQKYQIEIQGIHSKFNKSIHQINSSELELSWKRAQQSWFLPKWLNKRKIKKQLDLYKHNPGINDAEVEQFFRQIRESNELQQLIQQQRFAIIKENLKNLYKDELTDVNDLNEKAQKVKHLNELMSGFENGAFRKWISVLQQKLVYTDDVVNVDKELWKDLILNYNQIQTELIELKSISQINYTSAQNWSESLLAQLQKVKSGLPKLKDWVNYLQLRNESGEMNLNWLVESFEQNKCTADELTDFFQFNVHKAFVQYFIELDESLNLFNSVLFESKIEHYKKIAKDFRELTIKELRIKLSAQIPNTSFEAMQSSEIGILQRAIKSKGRGMSIRRLFDQIPTLLPRIAPCMLMSPISVAQYFDVDSNHFDLVIFDEASQLPTCEAVSALARAKQAIIVGDPRQMPPTSFFSTNKLDEENMEVEDLESILDDCLSLSVPSKYLLRHYRSKHESLIAFSNINYYESKLLTFPSADDLDRKVRYYHIPGFYDKGKTRTNRFEADAIAEYVYQHYKNPERNHLSIGVVTFSQTQQTLIDEKIQQLFRKDAKVEEFINESNEPLFIKNLENVQGDERDIILFSVGYAPDEEGKMTMNFGPLNRNGGWRRLNVAVTRARYEMHLFATLRADQIDLSRTSAEGVFGLKAFLNFAEKGHLVFRAEDVQATQSVQHLSSSICEKLEKRGLKVKNLVGTSGFKVDVGVVHPDHPEKYIMGIIVDGKYYHNAMTSNDRESVMPSVLKGLGWNVHRIWSVDWYENSESIVDQILEKVEELKKLPQNQKAEITEEKIKSPVFISPQIIEKETIEAENNSSQKPYQDYELISSAEFNSESIYDFRYRNTIKSQLSGLIETEQPISRGLLFRKLIQTWNISRMGGKLENHLDEILNELNFRQTNHHQPFYWNETADFHLEFYRNNEGGKRNMEDIAPEEILVALGETLKNNLSIQEDELIRYLSRTFGFSKVGKQIDVLIRYTIDLAEKEGKLKREGGRVKVV